MDTSALRDWWGNHQQKFAAQDSELGLDGRFVAFCAAILNADFEEVLVVCFKPEDMFVFEGILRRMLETESTSEFDAKVLNLVIFNTQVGPGMIQGIAQTAMSAADGDIELEDMHDEIAKTAGAELFGAFGPKRN